MSAESTKGASDTTASTSNTNTSQGDRSDSTSQPSTEIPAPLFDSPTLSDLRAGQLNPRIRTAVTRLWNMRLEWERNGQIHQDAPTFIREARLSGTGGGEADLHSKLYEAFCFLVNGYYELVVNQERRVETLAERYADEFFPPEHLKTLDTHGCDWEEVLAYLGKLSGHKVKQDEEEDA